jgi:peptidoglycan/LPS O-acetylase OafA/YrhL
MNPVQNNMIALFLVASFATAQSLPTATDCTKIWDRCKQSPEQLVASSIGDAFLDPTMPLLGLPPFLSTPVPLVKLAKALTAGVNMTNSTEAMQAATKNPLLRKWLFFRQAGNFDLCQSIDNSHYCTASLVSFKTVSGPSFGVCLPASCGADDYIKLSTECVAARAVNETAQTQLIRNIDHLIKNNTSVIAGVALLIAEELKVPPANVTAAINQFETELDGLLSFSTALHDSALSYLGKGAPLLGSTGVCYLPPPSTYNSGARWAIGIGMLLIVLVAAATVSDYLLLPHLAYVAKARAQPSKITRLSSLEEGGTAGEDPDDTSTSLLKPLLFSRLSDAEEIRTLAHGEKSAAASAGADSTKANTAPSFQWVYELTKCFSALETLERLCSDRTTGNFKALNGLRTLSCCYIILGHAFLVFGLESNPVNFYPTLIGFLQSFDAMVIIGAFCSVDTFFFISGFLCAYTMLRKLEAVFEKRKQSALIRQAVESPLRTRSRDSTAGSPSSSPASSVCALTPGMYFMMVLHRYLRLTPLYAFSLLVYMKLTPYLGDGPHYQLALMGDQATCEKWWWTNLLYINNVAPWGGPNGTMSCMAWSWYLANDFQFFLVSPFLLAVYLHSKRVGVALITAMIVGCVAVTGFLSHRYSLEIMPVSAGYNKHLYSMPYVRISPYLVGILLGIFFHERKKAFLADQQQKGSSKGGSSSGGAKTNTTMPKDQLTWTRVHSYMLAGALMVLFDAALLWDNYRRAVGGVVGVGTWAQSSKDLFNAFQRTLYAVGLAGICHMFFTGHGGPIRSFLEHPIFDPLAKLSYGAYIWALLIMIVKSNTQKAPPAFESIDVLWTSIACVVLGFAVSLISYVFLEKPMMTLEGKLMTWISSRR